jgi:hypothetical protein
MKNKMRIKGRRERKNKRRVDSEEAGDRKKLRKKDCRKCMSSQTKL